MRAKPQWQGSRGGGDLVAQGDDGLLEVGNLGDELLLFLLELLRARQHANEKGGKADSARSAFPWALPDCEAVALAQTRCISHRPITARCTTRTAFPRRGCSSSSRPVTPEFGRALALIACPDDSSGCLLGRCRVSASSLPVTFCYLLILYTLLLPCFGPSASASSERPPAFMALSGK